MSKGMQRQAALILAISTCPRYLLLDEIFDGLDPVVRRLVKKILIDNVSANDMTVVIASHNLRELEELCDRICLIHKGKLLLEREIDEIKLGLRKVQVAFTEVPDDSFFEEINVINLWRNGNIFNLTIRGTEDEFMPKLEEHKPLYISAVPMTLEEIFISEMGAAGYDAENIIKSRMKQAFSFFRSDLRACTPLLVVFGLISAVTVVICYTICVVLGEDMTFTGALLSLNFLGVTNSGTGIIEIFQYSSANLIYLISIIFTIIYTVRIYSYLHNKRKADLYGSLPIGRSTLFVTKTASAYLMSIIPTLFFLGVISIITVCTGNSVISELSSMFLKICLGTLASISFSVLLQFVAEQCSTPCLCSLRFA